MRRCRAASPGMRSCARARAPSVQCLYTGFRVRCIARARIWTGRGRERGWERAQMKVERARKYAGVTSSRNYIPPNHKTPAARNESPPWHYFILPHKLQDVNVHAYIKQVDRALNINNDRYSKIEMSRGANIQIGSFIAVVIYLPLSLVCSFPLLSVLACISMGRKKFLIDIILLHDDIIQLCIDDKICRRYTLANLSRWSDEKWKILSS